MCTESSRTQITLALRGCIVLISVNAVLGLMKRSTCVRDRTHSVVCCYLPVWRRATIVRSAIVARTFLLPHSWRCTKMLAAGSASIWTSYLVKVQLIVTIFICTVQEASLWPHVSIPNQYSKWDGKSRYGIPDYRYFLGWLETIPLLLSDDCHNTGMS